MTRGAIKRLGPARTRWGSQARWLCAEQYSYHSRQKKKTVLLYFLFLSNSYSFYIFYFKKIKPKTSTRTPDLAFLYYLNLLRIKMFPEFVKLAWKSDIFDEFTVDPDFLRLNWT